MTSAGFTIGAAINIRRLARNAHRNLGTAQARDTIENAARASVVSQGKS
jgi:hypothetical protein